MENELLTNKSAGALLRDAELELVKRRDYAVELRVIDPSAWDEFLQSDVTIPVEIQEFLSLRFPYDECGRRGRPPTISKHSRGHLTEKEVHTLEERAEHFHGVKPPYYIAMSITLQQTGRPWAYVPEAGEFLTGFTLGRGD